METIGGPNSAYAATPRTKRIGITIGGTRYLMVFLAREPERRVGVRSQHGVKRRRHKGKAGKHHHSVGKFLLLRAGLLSTLRGRRLA